MSLMCMWEHACLKVGREQNSSPPFLFNVFVGGLVCGVLHFGGGGAAEKAGVVQVCLWCRSEKDACSHEHRKKMFSFFSQNISA